MRIVILGYTGLIGNSVLEYLTNFTSYHLICVGRRIKNKPYKSPKISYLSWNFKSFKKSKLLFLNKADVVINCIGKTDDNLNDLNNINVNFIQKLLKHISIYKLKIRFLHLSSVSVYGDGINYFGLNKTISEKSKIKLDNPYSKSKFKGDLLIKDFIKKKINKDFSYTILRISNVFGGAKKTNLLKFIEFSIKYAFWIKCSNKIMFNFVNVKDVAQAVILVISKLKVSKNKIYIVSDDCRQFKFYNYYQILLKKKIRNIQIPLNCMKFLINIFPLSKKIKNFILIISTRISYSNKKIKKELNFNPRFSLIKNIKSINE